MVQGARERSTSPQKVRRSQSPETRWTTQSAVAPAENSAASPEAFRSSGVSDPLRASGGGGGGSDPVAEARESLRREMVESERMMRDMTGRSAAVRFLPPLSVLPPMCFRLSRFPASRV